MRATSILVFGVPHSPLAQPRNVIGGNLIGALVSAALVRSFRNKSWVMATAVSRTILLMKMSRTVHPPSGAVAFVGVMSEVSWDLVIAPVLAGLVVIVLWTSLLNNVAPGRSYPLNWL